MASVHHRVSGEWPPGSEPQSPAKNQRRHLIIAGTGRAGTSLLVRYLTELGLDRTLARNGDMAEWDAEANAGLENVLISGNKPSLCD